MIDATDRQIDGLVYEVYGLTEEEIRIVEEGMYVCICSVMNVGSCLYLLPRQAVLSRSLEALDRWICRCQDLRSQRSLVELDKHIKCDIISL